MEGRVDGVSSSQRRESRKRDTLKFSLRSANRERKRERETQFLTVLSIPSYGDIDVLIHFSKSKLLPVIRYLIKCKGSSDVCACVRVSRHLDGQNLHFDGVALVWCCRQRDVYETIRLLLVHFPPPLKMNFLFFPFSLCRDDEFIRSGLVTMPTAFT